jgi:hypothetical protein
MARLPSRSVRRPSFSCGIRSLSAPSRWSIVGHGSRVWRPGSSIVDVFAVTNEFGSSGASPHQRDARPISSQILAPDS